MIGEPKNLFISTLSKTVQSFYNNRYDKIGKCWKNIDDATFAIKRLISTSSHLKKSPLPGIIDNFSASAKDRCQLMRSDPDFDEAAGYLRANRNQIREFQIVNTYPGRERDNRIMKLVQRYRKLVYDIAHVRTERDNSTPILVREIDKERIINYSRQSREVEWEPLKAV
jgi:hypothetical protein